MSTYNKQPELTMKWHNFLIYFSLWAGGILSIVSGCQVMTGTHYGLGASDLERLYSLYGSLKTVDLIFGVLMIVAGVFLIYTRFQLAGFKEGAPNKLTICYALNLVVSLAYIFAAAGAINEPATELMDASTGSTIVTSIVMIIVNRIYYAKRAHLFGAGAGAYTAASTTSTYTHSSTPYAPSTSSTPSTSSAAFCPKCGTKAEAGDMFCANCGAKLK